MRILLTRMLIQKTKKNQIKIIQGVCAIILHYLSYMTLMKQCNRKNNDQSEYMTDPFDFTNDTTNSDDEERVDFHHQSKFIKFIFNHKFSFSMCDLITCY